MQNNNLGTHCEQSGTKPNSVAKFWLPTLFFFLYDICNVFKNMFDVALIMMWQSIVVMGFPTTETWAFENLEGYQLR